MSASTPGPQKSQDLTGNQVGDYLLLRRLGSGGMADVYLARQSKLIERNVALKILKPELAEDESYVKRFHREAQSAATLVQANIVQIYEVDKADGLHFIAQEYVQGRNLRQYLERHGAVEPVMAITVLRQCAMALQKAAEFDVVHRDIKPENIMLSTNGEVKVTDFGLARVNNDAAQQALTQIGITMGTPLYMSPEQVEGGALDSRSDVYSLGVTAYHMLAGEPPFNGENALAIAVQQVNESATPLATIRPDVPTELCDIIHQMISKSPKNRPQDATQLLKELRKVKIDVDEDWDLLIEKLAVTEPGFQSSQSLSEAKLAATQQLQTVMRGNVKSWWRHPYTLLALAAASLVGIGIGIQAATSSAPEYPLAVAQVGINEIPRKENVKEQYIAAFWGTYGEIDDQKKVDYWKAVVDYFPMEDVETTSENKTKLYHQLAKLRLGEVLLSQSKLGEAWDIYSELERDGDVSEHFRLMGIAGKAIVYDLTPDADFGGGKPERDQKVKECLGQIGSKLDLLNETMRRRIAGLRNRYPAATPESTTET